MCLDIECDGKPFVTCAWVAARKNRTAGTGLRHRRRVITQHDAASLERGTGEPPGTHPFVSRNSHFRELLITPFPSGPTIAASFQCTCECDVNNERVSQTLEELMEGQWRDLGWRHHRRAQPPLRHAAKQAAFDEQHEGFTNAASYAAWVFNARLTRKRGFA